MTPRSERRYAVGVVAAWAVFAVCWIYFSDRLLENFGDIELVSRVSTYKGLLFVAISAVFFWLALQRRWSEQDGDVSPPTDVSRRGVVFFALAVVTIAFLGQIVYRSEADSLKAAAMRQVRATAALQTDGLSRWLDERAGNARVFAADATTRAFVTRLLDRGEEVDRRRLADALALVRDTYGFAAAAIVGVDRKVILGDAAAVSDRPIFEAAFTRALGGALSFVDLHRWADGSPHFGYLAPIYATDDRSGRPLAVVALDLRPERHLYPSLQVWPVASRTGTTLIARVEGDRVVYLVDPPDRPGGAFSAGGRLDDPDLPAARQARTGEGTMTGIDYRGVRVIAAGTTLPTTGWILISKVDEEEALGALGQRMLVAGAAISIAVFACLGLAYFYLQQLRLKSIVGEMEQRRRADAAEIRYRKTFEEAPIGIAHVSFDSVVLRFNRAFAEIGGLCEVSVGRLRLLDLLFDEDRAPVAEGLARMARGEAEQITSRRRILGRNGDVVHVEITASRLHDAGPAGDYVIAMVTDVTARVAAEEALKASEERFDLAMRGTDDGLWDWNIETGTVFFSPRWKEMLGYGADEVANRIEAHAALLHPDDVAATQQSTQDILSGRADSFRGEFRLRSKSGEWRHVLSRAFVVRDAQGRPKRMVGTQSDITERKRTEAELRSAAAVFTNTQEGVAITDPTGIVLAANPAFTAITGWDGGEIIGRNIGVLKSGRQKGEFYRAMWAELQRNGHWQGEIWNRRRNGEIYPEWLTISSVRDETGAVTHRVATFTDISRLKDSEARLEQLALFDSLTGLPNRLRLETELEREVERVGREKSRAAVLFLDLDRFRNVNESLGHVAGDELLVQVARRLARDLPEGAVLARIGGDEFVGLLSDVEGRDGVAAVAARWVARLDEPFVLSGGQEIYTSASVGIACCPHDGVTAGGLLRHADAALYDAKRAGGGTLRFWSRGLTAAAVDRLETEAGLRRALDRGELELHYQPLVAAADGRVCGLEALVRWRDPKAGLIGPGSFIPVAEETGLIIPIGDWVRRTACRQIRQWRDAGLDVPLVAVNLSAREFQRSDLARRVADVLAESGLPPACLEIEITETALMEQGSEIDRRITALGELGIRLAIDDFGTGYSSLASLRRLPIDKLKIDRSFVCDLPGDRMSSEIVATMVALGHTLGLEVLAEGVETAEQLATLESRGCDLIQGFLYSPPVPSAEVPGLLARLAARARHESLPSDGSAPFDPAVATAAQ
jgi:diguanylate cyclase (GGDEF)-like protein/PAS domain S-box-containing protein